MTALAFEGEWKLLREMVLVDLPERGPQLEVLRLLFRAGC